MKLATWNVNSLRVRLDRVLNWLETTSIDILCLQEIKMQTELFPTEVFKEKGYYASVFGQKTYNGVAVISKFPIETINKNMGDVFLDEQSRLIDVNINLPSESCPVLKLINVYIPNGESVTSDKFIYKQHWLSSFINYLKQNNISGIPSIICGDFNIAPFDIDTFDSELYKDNTPCSDIEREFFKKILSLGFKDILEETVLTQGPVFTWWDYRQLSFQKNHGLRIDHILISNTLQQLNYNCLVDKNERKGKQPSDHAPVCMDISI